MMYYGQLPEEPKNPCLEGCMQWYKGVCSRGEDCYTKNIYDQQSKMYQSFLSALKPVDVNGLAAHIDKTVGLDDAADIIGAIEQAINQYKGE